MDLCYAFDGDRFRLGKLCKHGHAWPGTEQSLRRNPSTASNCMGCTGRKDSDWLLSFLDYEAMGWPPGRTLGKLCKAGHQWNGLDASLRNKHGQCVCCQNIRRTEDEKRRALDPDYLARRSAAAMARTARRMAEDPEGELFKRKESQRRRVESGKVRQYKAATRKRFLEQGLTTRGVKRTRGTPEQALQKAIRNAGRCPSVARLVMDAQLQHWREHPEDRAEHRRQWAQARWWLRYAITPDLRLYHREKSKRRKAQARGQTPVQVPVAALRQRFNEFGNCCAYCGASGDMEIEHVDPINNGGPHDIGNIVPACSTCNTSKKEKEMESWYRSQPFFSEIRLHQIRRVIRPTESQQLALALA